MGVIFTPKHLIGQMQQCALILIRVMYFHTENVYYGDFPTVHVLIFLTKKKMKKTEETTPTIRFHIYYIIVRCTAHGRIPLKDEKIFYLCKQESSPDKSTKIYTRKELFMTETKNYDFRTSFYIPSIQKLAFYLPHVCILATNHFG